MSGRQEDRRSPVDDRQDHESVDAWFRRLAIQRGIVLVNDEDFFVTLLDYIDALTAERDALRARPWLVVDQYDGVRVCESEQHALDEAQHLIENCLDDGRWDESVEAIRVVQEAHVVRKTVLAVKSEMDPSQWDELTGGSDADEWWDFTLVPQLRNSPSPVNPEPKEES